MPAKIYGADGDVAQENDLREVYHKELHFGSETLDNPHYTKVATLPASSGTTHDELHVEILGQDWTENTSRQYFMLKNRSGLKHRFHREGHFIGGRTTLVAYEETSGDVAVYVKSGPNSYVTASVRAYSHLAHKQDGSGEYRGPILAKDYGTTVDTVPPGTLVFDGDTYTPNSIFEHGVEAWHDVAFLNNWANYGGAYNVAGYFKDANGIVHLRGLIGQGNVDTPAFQLPAGYRPVQTCLFPTISSSSLGRVDVFSDGDVTPKSPSSSSWVSLEGLTFRAEL